MSKKHGKHMKVPGFDAGGGRELVPSIDMGGGARTLGFGRAVGAGVEDVCSAIIADVADERQAVLWIQNVHFSGPQLDSNLVQTFDETEIDLLGDGQNVPGAVQVTSTGLDNGRATTPMLITGLFVWMEPPPYWYEVQGNAFARPTAAGANMVVSPDNYDQTLDTAVTGGTNALGLAAADTSFGPATMDYGGWIQRAILNLAQGFNLHWQFAINGPTFVNWPLRDIMWVANAAREDSAGVGSLNIMRHVNAMNGTYAGAPFSSADVFLPTNARRDGAATKGGAVVSTFALDRSGQMVTPMVGGIGLREIVGQNARFWGLERPIIMPRNTKLNIKLLAMDEVFQSQLVSELSVTNGLGLPTLPAPNTTIPPEITPFNNFGVTNTAANAGQTFLDLTKDSPPAQFNQTPRNGVRLFKWGDWTVRMGALGRELKEAEYQAACTDQGKSLLASTGCCIVGA